MSLNHSRPITTGDRGRNGDKMAFTEILKRLHRKPKETVLWLVKNGTTKDWRDGAAYVCFERGWEMGEK